MSSENGIEVAETSMDTLEEGNYIKEDGLVEPSSLQEEEEVERESQLIKNKEEETMTEGVCSFFTKQRGGFRILDIVLYFLMGILGDLDIGYAESPTFQSFVAVANFNAAPGALSVMAGILCGALLATFVLMYFSPTKRVLISAIIQIIGALFFWTLPSPYDSYFGNSVLLGGMAALQITILPLTYYAGPPATRAYVLGQGISPFLGMGLINILVAIGASEAAYMVVLILFPILTCICFFCLDHSAFSSNKAVSKRDGDVLNTNNSDNDIDRDLSQLVDEIETEAEADVEEKDGSKKLSKQDAASAFKEIMYTYLPPSIIYMVISSLFNSAVSMPKLQSSSFSYAGYTTQEEVIQGQDQVALTTTAVSSVVVLLSILTPLGKIVPNLSWWVIWFPVLAVVVLFFVSSLGLLADAFPPMPIGALYFIQIIFGLVASLQNAYIPLFIGADKSLTEKYREFQLQCLLIFGFIFALIATSFSLFYFTDRVLEGCQSNYEANYDGVSCNNFS